MKQLILIVMLCVQDIGSKMADATESSGTESVRPANDVIFLTGFRHSLNIEPVPASLGAQIQAQFDRYTKVIAPNGGAIHIIAQDLIADEQLVRARHILEHYLTDYPGSVYGADKSLLANQMANSGQILSLMNGSDDGQNPVEPPGQPLYQNEIQVEGHTWYVNQDYDQHRDAAYEEILHFVHDAGIGVDGPGGSPGVLPLYQSEIRAAQANALSQNIWGIGAADWIAELTAENSLTQEYLAALIDSYYGLWGAWAEDPNTGMWGIYLPKTRAEISTEDPQGQALMANKLFHPYLTYDARIDAGFNGTFSLMFDAALPYTHHARYLKDITLTGSNNIWVRVNELDNQITGNAGLNRVIFTGHSSEYQITTEGEATIVIDNMTNRDGQNHLRQVEEVSFSDQVITL